jgi:hypothetical protein
MASKDAVLRMVAPLSGILELLPLNGAPGLRRPLPCLVTHERGTVALRGEVLARGALDILTSVRSVSVGYHGVDITQVRCALFNTASKWFISTDS